MDFGAPPHDREPVTTIAWRLAHLIVGFAETNGSHFGGPPAHVSTFHYAGTAGEALRQLDDTHETPLMPPPPIAIITSHRRSRKFCPLCTLLDHFNVRNARNIHTKSVQGEHVRLA